MKNRIFSFPETVNEVAARLVAGMVVSLVAAIVASREPLLLAFLAYGFLARVLTGPTLSPMALLATRVIVPATGLPVRLVPGPPKRFAQFVGLVFSATALFIWVGLGFQGVAVAILGVLAAFATLEAVAGICAGCIVFNAAMRWGLVPRQVCEACADFTLQQAPQVRPSGRMSSPR